MFRKRIAILAAALTFVSAIGLPVVFPVAARASLDNECRFDLTKDRFDGVDAVISAAHTFTRDVTSFIDVGATDFAELNSDFRQSRRDLRQDFKFGLQDIAQARGEAIDDLHVVCGNISAARVHKELAFYDALDIRLARAYRKARIALRKAYIASLQSCCVF
jgi:hypothetical protein